MLNIVCAASVWRQGDLLMTTLATTKAARGLDREPKPVLRKGPAFKFKLSRLADGLDRGREREKSKLTPRLWKNNQKKGTLVEGDLCRCWAGKGQQSEFSLHTAV